MLFAVLACLSSCEKKKEDDCLCEITKGAPFNRTACIKMDTDSGENKCPDHCGVVPDAVKCCWAGEYCTTCGMWCSEEPDVDETDED